MLVTYFLLRSTHLGDLFLAMGALGWVLLVASAGMLGYYVLYPAVEKRWELWKVKSFAKRVNTILNTVKNSGMLTLDDILWFAKDGLHTGVDWSYIN
ncbi:hypothetical protein BJ508DRAFT_419316 [Ascobolus immersus RN42]|uniref:Uncharacterized protein n=1 Tax=Ascobolus immersus RN42 TaxID=1160509 RepID=A0A3N4HEV1_ASCIM|nr:hypothetical protein BJ508DRAFT_419316 [Ascobolus immersus RN42]